VRTYQYQEPLAQKAIEMTILPLFEDDYVRALYGRTARGTAALAAFVRRFRRLLDVADYDAIWIEKEMLPWLPASMELALLPRGIPVVLDYDDAVFHRYDMHRSAVVRSILGRKLDRLMERADLVMAGNDYLADRARRAGAKWVEIVPTVVDLERYVPSPPRATDVVTVGWIGSPSTAHYLDIVKPVIDDLARERSVKAIAIGARADQVADSRFSAVPWSEETEVESLRACDIGIMPLADTPWERGKCGYKLIQYMALGLPVVASPIGVNSLLAGSGNGLLANSATEWHNALKTLLTDAKKRLALGAAGRKRIEDGYSLQQWAGRVAALIRGTTV
jgi:glycosyltransferase involved in cell wall biosynthesis